MKRNQVLKDLSDGEFSSLVSAMKQIEGNKPGREEKFRVKEIVGIRMNNRNSIIAYNVEDYGWLSKPETIALTEQGRIDAVVVTEKGKAYIRTRPDQSTINNLDQMKPQK